MRKLFALTTLACSLMACSGGTGGAGEITGYRFTMTTTMGGQRLAGAEMRATGAMDIAGNAMQLSTTTRMPSFPSASASPSAGFGLGGVGAAFGLGGGSSGLPGSITQEMIVAGNKVYMRLAGEMAKMYGAQLPPGKQWFEAPGAAAGATMMLSNPFGPGDDPKAFFPSFKRMAKSLRTIGAVDLAGVATTRYDATVDLATALKPVRKQVGATAYRQMLNQFRRAPPFTMSVWIGDDDLPYRVRYSLGFGGTSSTTVVDFYDYGDVSVDVPAAGVVAQFTPSSTSGSFSCTTTSTGKRVGTSTVNGVTTTTTC